MINQDNVQESVKLSLKELNTIYWSATTQSVRDNTLMLRKTLLDIKTALNKNLIKDNTDKFSTLATQFNNTIMPSLTNLQNEIQNDATMYNSFKNLLSNIEIITKYFSIE
jgi:hypothetical protein